MTPNMQMEQFSLAYIRAVAAAASCQVSRPEPTLTAWMRVDVQLWTSARIEFQAKSTTRDVLRNGIIHFPLPIKNYDELRVESWVPRILVVMLMPTDGADWLSQTDAELCLYHCAYWLSLAKMPSRANTASVTVEIPTVNMFDRSRLNDLMNKANDGRPLC